MIINIVRINKYNEHNTVLILEITDVTIKIYKLKEMIQNKLGIYSDIQVLVFSGITMDDNKSIEQFDIKDNSNIYLVVKEEKKIDIIIKTKPYASRNIIIQNVSPEVTIERIKYEIANVYNKISNIFREVITYKNLILLYKDMELQDNKNVSYYRMKNKDVLHLLIHMRSGF